MSRGVQSFRLTDVTKGVRGVVAAGIVVDRVEIDKAGKIVIIAAHGVEPETHTRNEEVLADVDEGWVDAP